MVNLAALKGVHLAIKSGILAAEAIFDEELRAAGYYDSALEPLLKRQAEVDIANQGYFSFEKNNYLIEGLAP